MRLTHYVDITLANILPPLFICLIMGTMWSVYLGLHVLPLLQLPISPFDGVVSEQDSTRGWHQLLVSQVLTSLLLICYARTVLTTPGTVPDAPEWKRGTREMHVPPTSERKSSGARRQCKWCNKYKPDRCHHCRVCKSCVLKMDHHCPWVMNCIGFRNHKYFFLLVVYSVLCCAFIGSTVLESVLSSAEKDMPSMNRFLLVLCLVLSLIMGCLMSAFLCFHVCLTIRGMTTIEFCEKAALGDGLLWKCGRSAYDHGLFENFAAVLGPQPLLWLLPVNPPVGDGMIYTTKAYGDAEVDPECTRLLHETSPSLTVPKKI